MARGWESKSVGDQIESAQSRPPRGLSGDTGPSVAEVELARKRENLLLSKTRVMRELESSKNPRYMLLLNRELQALEERLKKLS